jgi:PIN domain nuclease of toxin-antitoxin system
MILLDTHVVIWLTAAPDRISKAAKEAIRSAGARRDLPAISVATIYEITYAKRRGRVLANTSDAAMLARLRSSFTIIPVTETIALEAANFPSSFHGDPIDRIIAATAIVEGRALITADRQILAAGVCKTLW